MDEPTKRRRQRAYRILREMAHNTPKHESFRILDEAECLDNPEYKMREYESIVKANHKVCRTNRDIQMDMIPLWRWAINDEGVYTKERYLGKFQDMDFDEHFQHLDGRRTGIFADTRVFYEYFKAMTPRLQRDMLRKFDRNGGMPPEPPPDPDSDDDDDA